MKKQKIIKEFVVLTLYLPLLLGSFPIFPKLLDAEIKIVVPHCSFYDFAKAVVKDKGKVEFLADGRYNLHYVEPRPSYIPKLRGADFVIPIGLRLDVWFDALIQASGNPKIMSGSPGYIDVSRVVKILEIPEFEVGRQRYGDIHPEGNPHYWLSPENAERIVLAIGEHLSKILNDSEFRGNAEIYAREVRSLGEELRERFKSLKGVKIISYHKSWSYFADFLGFEVVETLEPAPGIPPTAQHIAKVLDVIKKLDLKALLYEPFYGKGVIERVEREAGIRGVMLYQDCIPSVPELKDYFSLMRFNIEKIISALEGRAR